MVRSYEIVLSFRHCIKLHQLVKMHFFLDNSDNMIPQISSFSTFIYSSIGFKWQNTIQLNEHQPRVLWNNSAGYKITSLSRILSLDYSLYQVSNLIPSPRVILTHSLSLPTILVTCKCPRLSTFFLLGPAPGCPWSRTHIRLPFTNCGAWITNKMYFQVVYEHGFICFEDKKMRGGRRLGKREDSKNLSCSRKG